MFSDSYRYVYRFINNGEIIYIYIYIYASSRMCGFPLRCNSALVVLSLNSLSDTQFCIPLTQYLRHGLSILCIFWTKLNVQLSISSKYVYYCHVLWQLCWTAVRRRQSTRRALIVILIIVGNKDLQTFGYGKWYCHWLDSAYLRDITIINTGCRIHSQSDKSG